jgi:hypothetical protein
MKRVAQAVALLIVAAAPAYAGPVNVAPEPATIGLVATGVGVLGLTAWIRKRRK